MMLKKLWLGFLIVCLSVTSGTRCQNPLSEGARRLIGLATLVLGVGGVGGICYYALDKKGEQMEKEKQLLAETEEKQKVKVINEVRDEDLFYDPA